MVTKQVRSFVNKKIVQSKIYWRKTIFSVIKTIFNWRNEIQDTSNKNMQRWNEIQYVYVYLILIWMYFSCFSRCYRVRTSSWEFIQVRVLKFFKVMIESSKPWKKKCKPSKIFNPITNNMNKKYNRNKISEKYRERREEEIGKDLSEMILTEIYLSDDF